jgi:ribosomal protein L18E
MGTLRLEASTDGASWTSLWEQTGDKGNQWLNATVDLSAYQSANVQFRFVGITGSSFRSDMAIDKLSIKGDDVLSLSSFSPASGAAQSLVTIAGANFDPTAANNIVKFNGVTATITQASAGQLSVLVPAGATTGKITIEVGGVTVTSATNFTPTTSTANVPTITNVSPNSGRVGDEITITGTNFDATAVSNTVKFNGAVATVTSATVTELKVTIPTGAFTGKITVEVNNLAAVSNDNFVVIYPLAITGFSPESGREGEEVTITGTNFHPTAANNTVKFNGTTATVSTATETEMKVTVPTGATTGKVTIDANGESVTSTNDFTVISAPAITGFSPKSGQAGDEITITGINFSTKITDNIVMLNGNTARVISATATELKVIVPSNATAGSGRISLVLFGFSALSQDNFTVIAPPVITSFLPTSGKAGDQIRIFGSGFGIFSDQVVVKFNGVVAQVNSVNGSVASVVVPEGSSTGKVTMEVNGLVGTSIQDFVVFGVSGLSAQLNAQLTLYPNPVYDLLRIRLQGKAAAEIKLTLYNLQGQEVLQSTQTFKNNEAALNLAGINAGEYVLVMTVGDKTAARRISKK